MQLTSTRSVGVETSFAPAEITPRRSGKEFIKIAPERSAQTLTVLASGSFERALRKGEWQRTRVRVTFADGASEDYAAPAPN